MKGLKLMAGLIGLFLTMPIWLYLVYKILEMVKATELMWFLYWVYVPAAIITAIFYKIADAND